MTELSCGLRAWGIEENPTLMIREGESFLTFETEKLPEAAWQFLSDHSGCCFAARMEGEALYPLRRGKDPYLPEELPQLLKYKGKTNADFTFMLLRCARAASAFAQGTEPLTILDPMCGKATTLFCAIQKGDNAVGLDVDGKALDEADLYFERCLQLHRLKHKREESSLTLTGSRSARCVSYTVADTLEHYKAGSVRTLRLIHGEVEELPRLMRRESCHLAVGDMPYGVQHAPQEGRRISTLERLMTDTAKGCAGALRKGGVLALSFNSLTLKRERALCAMEAAGLVPLDEAPYNGFSHWVEQAVERDAVLAVKQ
ncbi:MAG: hypothetical protein PHI98_16140 [Eubacteriales bacterium]|nr:hypothetical protein [Eubacteriales bacterium]